MLKTTLRTALAATVLVAGLGVVLAQPQADPKTPKSQTGMALRAKSILGSTVHLQGNTKVGTVEDFVIDDEGVIDFFIVSDGNKLITVPWEAAKFNFEKRSAVINITQEQFRQIPTYTTERYPEFYTPTYRTEIYKHYGLPAGQERRFERRINRK
jgi:hypothetical protein